MKILVICNSSSGLVDFRSMLLQRLKDVGNELTAIVPSTTNALEHEKEHELQTIGVRLVRVPIDRRGVNPVKDFSLLRNFIRNVRTEKPDLIITYTIKPNVYGGIAARLCRTPYAVNITGLGTAFQGNGLLRRFVTLLYKVALRKAQVVFFENNENRQIMLDAGVVRPEQTCLLNGAGVDLEKFRYKPYPENISATKFLFIGRVMREKGIDELFTAMRRLREEGIACSLDILGGFDEDYQDVISAYEAEGWLRYHGYQNDVRPFIDACHCFVLPSWHEGMANTNLECAACGRPVITSNIHGCLEAVEDGVTGYLCEKQNADALFETMQKFTTLSRTEREAMGLAGRERMEKHFDKQAVVEQTMAQLLKENKT